MLLTYFCAHFPHIILKNIPKNILGRRFGCSKKKIVQLNDFFLISFNTKITVQHIFV